MIKLLITLFLLPSLSFAKGFYDIEVQMMGKKTVKMSEFKGKNVLIVNTASHCGYTDQYEDLEKLYQQVKGSGGVVIGFPSKSFNQEFSTDKEVAKFCKMRFGVTFPLSTIVDVKSHPLFKHLISSSETNKGKNVAWNFEKFVVNKQGQIVGRFGSSVKPLDQRIVSLMKK